MPVRVGRESESLCECACLLLFLLPLPARLKNEGCEGLGLSMEIAFRHASIVCKLIS